MDSSCIATGGKVKYMDISAERCRCDGRNLCQFFF